ncbi:MAG: aldehyde ferredoxin oxidoreductase family protein [Spirochaetales bacterium]
MDGFFNKLLWIDLTKKEYRYEDIPDEVFLNYLGGKGLGAYLLFHHNPPGVSPFSPDNLFIITVGPATGTRVWSQSRFAVFSKSPATGGYGESYCGGTLAPQIKGCGIDAVVLSGRADTLTFLVITEAGVTFVDASKWAGKETYETEEALLSLSKDQAGAMVIGPAGEHLAACACIKSDKYRSLGRGGLGAVLGSKNIKGISFAGSRKAKLADESLLLELNRRIAQKGKESPVTQNYVNLGTPMQVAATNNQRCFPTYYWKGGYFELWQNLSADYMRKNFQIAHHACPNCFLKCTRRSTLTKGRHAGLSIDGPEFETIYALGGLNGLDSLEEVVWLNDLCDRLGLDTMSAGNLASFTTEAYKAGKVDFPMDYNQPDRMAELFRLIAFRQGVGEVLAQGIRHAAKTWGLEDLAVHVKGLEPAGFEPRVLKGMGLAYAVSARGACHLRATFYKAELSGQIPPDQIEGKARLFIDYEDRAALVDSLILCRFFRDFYMWDELRMLIRGTTGRDLPKEELELLAHRITQLTRSYNHREGLGPETDTLPRRFFREPTREGATLTEEEFRTLLSDYNAIHEEREKRLQARK